MFVVPSFQSRRVSLPFNLSSEYYGAILVIRDKLRKGEVDLSEIEQILEDKYQSMKHVNDCDEDKDDYALFTSQSNKKRPKKQSKGYCGYCVEFGHKAADCPIRKAIRIRARKENPSIKRIHPKLSVIIVENMDIVHVTVQTLMIVILLK